ncbi:MAG: 16S rRNA (uracil(1498)-N(3))-methyltransferase [Parachlamydiaceae bacterium]|nr:16S rRNA (uracil(1498)-N(3))-methyltransferase [Parachlamydiaceae bacterium]
MPKERYFVPQELLLHEDISLDGTEMHHLVTVMRSKNGDVAELVNGHGVCAQAKIVQVEKKRVILNIEDLFISQKSTTEIILAQAIPKLNRLDFIIEKGTELGMTQIWLFPSERGEKKTLSPTQLERLHHLSVAAMKQCGRLFLPEIKELPPLSQWLRAAEADPLYFGSLDPQAPLFLEALTQSSSSNAIFCVGPESGFSANEEKILIGLGAIGTKLNNHILRTETAAIAALVLMTSGK